MHGDIKRVDAGRNRPSQFIVHKPAIHNRGNAFILHRTKYIHMFPLNVIIYPWEQPCSGITLDIITNIFCFSAYNYTVFHCFLPFIKSQDPKGNVFMSKLPIDFCVFQVSCHKPPTPSHKAYTFPFCLEISTPFLYFKGFSSECIELPFSALT